MTGRQLIDAIQKYHLKDFDISCLYRSRTMGIIIEFEDAHFDAPAYIHKYKILEVNDEGNSKCYDTAVDTSKWLT